MTRTRTADRAASARYPGVLPRNPDSLSTAAPRPRLALTFGLLAAVSTAGVGLAVRTLVADKETRSLPGRGGGRLQSPRRRDPASRRGRSHADRGLVPERRACRARRHRERSRRSRRATHELLRAGPQPATRVRSRRAGPRHRGRRISSARAPSTLLGLPPRDVDALLHGNADRFTIRTVGAPALVSRCTKKSDGGRVVGLFAARHVDPLLERLAKTLDVTRGAVMAARGGERRGDRGEEEASEAAAWRQRRARRSERRDERSSELSSASGAASGGPGAASAANGDVAEAGELLVRPASSSTTTATSSRSTS